MLHLILVVENEHSVDMQDNPLAHVAGNHALGGVGGCAAIVQVRLFGDVRRKLALCGQVMFK